MGRFYLWSKTFKISQQLDNKILIIVLEVNWTILYHQLFKISRYRGLYVELFNFRSVRMLWVGCRGTTRIHSRLIQNDFIQILTEGNLFGSRILTFIYSKSTDFKESSVWYLFSKGTHFREHNYFFRPSMYTYFPFAIGPRSCLGQTFAQVGDVN